MAVLVTEKFANNASSTLNGSINDMVTTLDVTSASSFPSTGNFRIKIGDEIMTVTTVATNTFTVTRGDEGTAAASHTNLDPVTHVLTADALDTRLSDEVHVGAYADRPAAGTAGRLWLPNETPIIARDTGSIWTPYGPLYKFHETPLVSAFTWDNQGATTATDQAGMIRLDGGSATSDSARVLYKSAPSTPYHIIAAFKWYNTDAALLDMGLMFRQSSDGKLYSHGIRLTGTAATLNTLIASWITSTSTKTAVQGPAAAHFPADVFWARIGDDGATNRTFDLSIDGINWINLHTVSRTSHLTANQVGFFHNSTRASGTNVVQTLLLSWEETS